MSEHIQVHCPESNKHEVIELEVSSSGRPSVGWCSKDLGCPSCPQGCLKQLKTVGFMMVQEVPSLNLKELSVWSVDHVLELFRNYPHSVLPVLEDERLVGSLSYREVAVWQDNRAAQSGLCLEQWSHDPSDDCQLAGCWAPEAATLHPDDCWKVAVKLMLETHRDELFVTDTEGRFLGMVYARQLLRIAVDG